MTPDPTVQQEEDRTVEPEWHRLHPRMLLLHPFKAALDLAPFVLLAIVVGPDVSDLRLTIAVAVGLVVLSIGRWVCTTYALLPDSVDQRRGLLVRRRLSVPLSRIASADVEAPFLQRLLGLRTLRLTTASSSGGRPGSSIVLNAVDPARAEHLAARLDDRIAVARRARRAEVAEPGVQQDHAGPASDDAPSLLRWRPWWAAYAPLSASGFVALGGLGIVVAQFVGDVGAGGTVTRAYLFVFDRVGLWGTVAVLVGLSMLLSALLAAGNYLLVNWRFTVAPADGVLRIRRGLLSRRAVTLDTAKVRGVELQATLPVRLLGGTSTQAVVTGLGIVEQANTSTLAPLAPRTVGRRLAETVLEEPLADHDLPRHGPAAARRRLVRAPVGLTAVAAIAYASWWAVAGRRPDVPDWLLATAATLLVLSVPLAVDRYRRLGHRVGPLWVRTREGSLSSRSVVLRTDGVIGVVVRQSLSQRWSRVATVTLATAAGKQGYRVLDVPAADVGPDLDATGAAWWAEWRRPTSGD